MTISGKLKHLRMKPLLHLRNAGELLVARYPEILLLRQTYPVLKNDDVKDNALVRETTVEVYQFLTKPGYEPDDIL